MIKITTVVAAVYLLFHQSYFNPAFNNNISGKDSIEILQDYHSIRSLQELHNRFKNKFIFIDLWASWCAPCLDEFKSGRDIFIFLQNNKVQLLYISFDVDSLDNKWKNTIATYQLKGAHIRASKQLQDELTVMIWGGKDAYSIPKYILVDSNFTLLEKNIPNPSVGAPFYKTIQDKVAGF